VNLEIWNDICNVNDNVINLGLIMCYNDTPFFPSGTSSVYLYVVDDGIEMEVY